MYKIMRSRREMVKHGWLTYTDDGGQLFCIFIYHQKWTLRDRRDPVDGGENKKKKSEIRFLAGRIYYKSTGTLKAQISRTYIIIYH